MATVVIKTPEHVSFGDRISRCVSSGSAGRLLASVRVAVGRGRVGKIGEHRRSNGTPGRAAEVPVVELIFYNTAGGCHCNADVPPELALKIAAAVARKAVEAGAPGAEGLETQLALAVLEGDRAAALALRDRLAELDANT